MTQRGAQRPGQTTPLGLQGQKTPTDTTLIRHHNNHPPVHTIQTQDSHAMPCLHMGFLKYFIILLVIQHTCELMRYLCQCACWSINFPAGCSWVGWFGHLIFYSPMTKNRAASAYNIFSSFGGDGDALSQQTAVSQKTISPASPEEEKQALFLTDPLLAVPTSPTPDSRLHTGRVAWCPPPTVGSTHRKAIVSWSTEINKAIQTTLINPTRLWEREKKLSCWE